MMAEKQANNSSPEQAKINGSNDDRSEDNQSEVNQSEDNRQVAVVSFQLQSEIGNPSFEQVTDANIADAGRNYGNNCISVISYPTTTFDPSMFNSSLGEYENQQVSIRMQNQFAPLPTEKSGISETFKSFIYCMVLFTVFGVVPIFLIIYVLYVIKSSKY